MICIAQWPLVGVLDSLGAAPIVKIAGLGVCSQTAILSTRVQPIVVVPAVIANLLAVSHLLFAGLMVLCDLNGGF